MKTQKNLGIWMDHSIANLIDLNNEKISHSITSEFTSNTKEEALSRSESIMNNKEQQMREAFYKEIADEILKHDNVFLFGPTDAKLELKNYLLKDLHFDNIFFEVESADNMTDNEKIAFVRDHFEVLHNRK